VWLPSQVAAGATGRGDEARRVAEDAGLTVIMGVCIQHVRERLMEEEP